MQLCETYLVSGVKGPLLIDFEAFEGSVVVPFIGDSRRVLGCNWNERSEEFSHISV